MVSWPNELIEILGERYGILFLGAGASIAGLTPDSTKLPDWLDLLRQLGQELQGADSEYFKKLLCQNKLLDAAQLVTDCIPKQRRRKFLHDLFNSNQMKPGDFFTHINLIDQPVVMTTNYDRLYEKFWDSFTRGDGSPFSSPLTTRSYTDSDIVAPLREPRSRVYLKLHGCISKPDDIVLSKSDYNKARNEHSNFFQIVSALFQTRTVLFIGCGFSGDPDIELILEDAAFVSSSAFPHYALIPAGHHPSFSKSLKNLSNIDLIEYPLDSNGGHSKAKEAIEELAKRVEDYRSMQTP
ncbi:SIR2 family NAD-dependent protein deacylase [Trueperella pyogenes]|uniref:SIR2 family NAD-dependent protein deacylase n=1 Tax=Trueperella pyogenes TaxID=1661 RepID=UPI00345CD0B4